MSGATQTIRITPLPSIGHDPILSRPSAQAAAAVTRKDQIPRDEPAAAAAAASPSLPDTPEHGSWINEQKRRLLTGHRVCHRCKWRIENAPTTTLGDPIKLLHTTCTNCSATQCRGCSALKPLCRRSRQCDAKTCRSDLLACCPTARAIAIFEVLSEFDKELSAGAAHLSQSGTWPVPPAERSLFLDHITSRADARLSNRFNKLLGSTLDVINRSLLPPLLPEAGSGTASSSSSGTAIDPIVRPLLVTSFLFEAIHAYLRHDRYLNWAINARDAYLPIMQLLYILGSRHSLVDLLMKPLPSISVSSGVQVLVWYPDEPYTIWLTDGEHPESLFTAAFSNNAQQSIADLEKILEKHNSAGPTSNLRMAFYKLLLLDVMGATLP